MSSASISNLCFQLIHTVLSFLADGGVCHVWLQATALGEPLYRTFGFRDRGISFFASPIAVDAASFVRKDDHVQKQPQSEHAASLLGIQLRGATVQDLEEVSGLDCKAYGYCRYIKSM